MDKATAKAMIKALEAAYDVKPPFLLARCKISKGHYGIELSIRHKQAYMGDLTDYETICWTEDVKQMAEVLEALSYCNR